MIHPGFGERWALVAYAYSPGRLGGFKGTELGNDVPALGRGVSAGCRGLAEVVRAEAFISAPVPTPFQTPDASGAQSLSFPG